MLILILVILLISVFMNIQLTGSLLCSLAVLCLVTQRLYKQVKLNVTGTCHCTLWPYGVIFLFWDDIFSSLQYMYLMHVETSLNYNPGSI